VSFTDTIKTEININEIETEIIIDKISNERVINYLKSNAIEEFIVVNISAGQKRNTWNIEGYIEVIEELLKRYSKLKFVIISIKEDLYKAIYISDVLKKALPKVLVYPPTSDILEIGALLSHCKLVVSPDTAIIHLAATFKKPVIGLYMYNEDNLRDYRPYRVPYKMIIAEAGKEVNTINSEEVIKSTDSLLKEVYL
jgi:ADP-heptose:LPS heptosyltransferase